MKRRIEKKVAAIQARRYYGIRRMRRADLVYTYEISSRNGCTVVFTARPLVRGAIPARCSDAIRVRENTKWCCDGLWKSSAAWDSRCRKYKEARHGR
jgi:hypothetical protein